ncbi:hypothetical protein FF1_034372 [Malus domestica]
MDCSSENMKLSGIGSGIVGRTLQQSMIDESRKASFDDRLSLDLGNAELLKDARQNTYANSAYESSVPSNLTASDTDSVSYDSTSGMQDAGGAKKDRTLPRGIAVSDPGSPSSTNPVSRAEAKSVQSQSKRFNGDVSLSSSSQAMASPTRVPTRPASPGKLWSSSSLSSIEDERGLDQVHASTGGLMTSKEVVAELMSDDFKTVSLHRIMLHSVHTINSTA